MKKRTFSPNRQPSFVYCLTHSGGSQQSNDGFVHFPFKLLKDESWLGVPDGLVPFGTFPFVAPFSSLLSLPCDRGPSEGELSRSRLPLPLPFFCLCHVWKSMTLLWSTFLSPLNAYTLWLFRLRFCLFHPLSV